MNRQLKTIMAAALLCLSTWSAMAKLPPYLVSVVVSCGDFGYQLDVTYGTRVDLTSAMDSFNYIVFQNRTNGAPQMWGQQVTDTSPYGTSFRVLFSPDPNAPDPPFLPDAESVLLVQHVTDVGGGLTVEPKFYALHPCPETRLDMARMSSGSFGISWTTNYPSLILESTTSLSSPAWQPVTNSIGIEGDRFVIQFDAVESQQFYRLRKP